MVVIKDAVSDGWYLKQVKDECNFSMFSRSRPCELWPSLPRINTIGLVQESVPGFN